MGQGESQQKIDVGIITLNSFAVQEFNQIRETFLKSDVSIEELLSKLLPAKERYDESKRQLINEGGQGLIYKIKCKIDGKFYAMKSFKEDFFKVGVDRIYKEEIFREIDNLRQLDHPHIAKIVDIVKD